MAIYFPQQTWDTKAAQRGGAGAAPGEGLRPLCVDLLAHIEHYCRLDVKDCMESASDPKSSDNAVYDDIAKVRSRAAHDQPPSGLLPPPGWGNVVCCVRTGAERDMAICTDILLIEVSPSGKGKKAETIREVTCARACALLASFAAWWVTFMPSTTADWCAAREVCARVRVFRLKRRGGGQQQAVDVCSRHRCRLGGDQVRQVLSLAPARHRTNGLAARQ